ncbi:MAG: bifunctional riboflavin kinase/FAD synthetase [bacterium]
MRIFHNKADPFLHNSVCALGNFDGIHRGHREIIERLKDFRGKDRNIGIITFDPSPVSVLHTNEIFFLTTIEEKEKILCSLDIDFVFYFKFDREFSEKNPEEFVQLVYKTIQPYAIIVGENFHFGKNRKGTAKLFKELAQGKFLVEILPRIKDQEGVISSTRIRELLLLGNIPGANRILGRNYSLTGKVEKGKGKGTKLGFPTINLNVKKEKLLPLDGVYEVRLAIDNTFHKGAMFLSHNEIEVHILNFSGNLYQQEITVEFIRRIRAIKRFADDESLRKAIAEDIEKIRG